MKLMRFAGIFCLLVMLSACSSNFSVLATDTPQPTFTPPSTPTILITTSGSSVDVTSHVEVLGNPYQAKYPSGQSIYARNIWDMLAFNGELLIGAGNSSNLGPAQNAGPVPVFSYSPLTGQFRVVFTVDDEQIDVFRVLGGEVYIPGHDPRESWELGNFYRLESDSIWRKYRNIPLGIHNYDMSMIGSMLFAGLGTSGGAEVAVSRNSGGTWTNTPVLNDRIYAFLVDKEELYATGSIFLHSGIYQYDGKDGFRTRYDIGPNQLFPGVILRTDICTKIARPVTFKGHAAYLGAYCHNDHQFIPFGMFIAESLKEGNILIYQVTLPQDSRVWDLLVIDDIIYVLMESPNTEGTTISVAASSDGIAWTEIMNFRSKTFARSFALLNDDFYFGLGCEVKDPSKWDERELVSETGQILRVKRDFWRKPT